MRVDVVVGLVALLVVLWLAILHHYAPGAFTIGGLPCSANSFMNQIQYPDPKDVMEAGRLAYRACLDGVSYR